MEENITDGMKKAWKKQLNYLSIVGKRHIFDESELWFIAGLNNHFRKHGKLSFKQSITLKELYNRKTRYDLRDRYVY